MLKERLEKIKREELIKLSQKSREAINSVDWENLSENIGKKYLIDEEIESFQIEIILVLLGLEKPESLEKNIMEFIITSEKEAREIADEVFDKIFSPIANKLENDSTPIKATPKPISPKFNSLPENLKTAISLSDYQNKVYSLGKKYSLSIDEMGILEEVVSNIMLGTLPANNLENEIKYKIEIPEDKARELIEGLNESIFKNIRELLKTKNENSLEKNETEDVPLPPYAKKEVLTPKIEEKTAAIEGVEIIEEPEIKDQVDHVSKDQESGLYAKSGIEFIEEEKEDNKQIHIDEEKENKTLEDTGVDIIGERLTNPTISPSSVSDHTTKGISGSLDEKPSNYDPYREEIG
ncbi:MAG: hypothetical protein PHT84_01795 [Candidatus Pacebacteria bacterium]|nr:hypothetical protein [Candidatus Paceibacterota bacterium]